MVVANVGPIGCIPFQREINPKSGDDDCVSFPNQMAQLFNTQLKSLVAELSANLDASKFLYADVYAIVDDIIHNYQSFGLCTALSYSLLLPSFTYQYVSTQPIFI